MYKIGNEHVEIIQTAFETFADWSLPPKNDDVRYDKRFCFALLLALVPGDKLAIGDVSTFLPKLKAP